MSKYGVISGPNTGKYGPEITPYLDTFHAVRNTSKRSKFETYIYMLVIIYYIFKVLQILQALASTWCVINVCMCFMLYCYDLLFIISYILYFINWCNDCSLRYCNIFIYILFSIYLLFICSYLLLFLVFIVSII